MIKCDCLSLNEIEINSYKLFEELKEYFNKKIEENVFQDVAVKKPLQIIDDNGKCVKCTLLLLKQSTYTNSANFFNYQL